MRAQWRLGRWLRCEAQSQRWLPNPWLCLTLRQGVAEGLALKTSRLKRVFSGMAPPLYLPDSRPPARGLKVVVPSP